MRKLSVLIFILFITLNLPGYTCWEDNGIPIRQETNLYWDGSNIQLSDGSSVIVWSDASNGQQELRAQRISTAGETLWADSGVLLSETHNMNYNYTLKVSAEDDIFVSWMESIDTVSHQVRGQKLDINGNTLWDDNGIVIVGDDTVRITQFDLALDEDGNSLYFVRIRRLSYYWYYVYKLDNNGVTYPGWSAIGIPVNEYATDHSCGRVVTVENNVFCLWKESAGPESYQYYQIYSSDGQAQLTPGGEIFTEDFFFGGTPELKVTSEYQILIFGSSFTGSGYDARAQLIDLTGEDIWEEYLIFHDENSAAKTLVQGQGNDYFCTWYEHAEPYGMRISKFNLTGELLWSEPYLPGNGEQDSIDLKPDANGGIWISWSDQNSEIMLQHLNSDRQETFAAPGILVSDLGLNNYIPSILLDENDEIMLNWYSERESQQRLYLQKIDYEGNLLWGEDALFFYSRLGGRTNYFDLAGNDQLSVIAWTDTRCDTTLQDIYMQIVDNATGEICLCENGICVATDADQYVKTAITDNSELFGIVYRKMDTEHIYFQMINASGELLFPDDGLFLYDCYGNPQVIDLQILPAADYFMLLWSTPLFQPDEGVHLQKINESGFQWGENGIMHEFPVIVDVLTAKENYCVLWEFDHTEPHLHVLRFTEDGAIAPNWDTSGLEIATGDPYLSYMDAELVNDQLLVIWSELFTDSYEYSISGQLINPDGTSVWETGGRLLMPDNTSCPYNAQYTDLEIIDDQSFLLSYKDANNGNTYIQKFDMDGVPLWEYDGINPFEVNSSRYQQIVSYGDVIGIYSMFLHNPDDYYNYDLYGTFYDLDGNLWEGVSQAGFPICDLTIQDSICDIERDSQGNNYLCWFDNRTKNYNDEYENDHSSLYMQKIELPTLVIGEDEIVSFSKISNYPNPFTQSTTLKCDLPRSIENAEIVIYNIRGQKVRTLPTTANEIEWDCHNDAGKLAGAGVYFYRLRGEGIESRTGRMILLR